MADVDEKTKRNIRASLRKLAAFGEDPGTEQSWSEAATAAGALGDTVGKLLNKEPREDTAFATSLTVLLDQAESLRRKPSDQTARDDFNIALGDIKYRVKRLFGVEVR